MSVDMNSQGSDSNEEDYDPNCEGEGEREGVTSPWNVLLLQEATKSQEELGHPSLRPCATFLLGPG